jgi:hypothetical protein
VVESPQDWSKQANLKKLRKKDRRLGSSIKNRPGQKYPGDQGLLFVPIHWDTLIYLKTTNQDNKDN